MYRRVLPLAFGLLCVSGAAHANPGINGYSGKPFMGMSDTCETNCHKPPSTPVPTVTITIPTTVQAGSTSDVTLVIAGTRARTSFDAAFSDGVVVTGGTNTNVPFPTDTPWEVVAKDPPPSGGTGTYKFSFTAPATNGTITLWVAAMSASGSGTANDAVVKTTRTITVTGGSSADGGSTSSSSSSSSSGSTSSGGTTSSSGATTDEDGGSSSGTSSSGSGSGARRLSNGGDDGGCRSAPRSAPHDAWLFVALAAAALIRTRSGSRHRSA